MPARTPRSELLKIHNPLLARLETGDGEGLQLPPSSHLTGPLTRPLTTAYGCWIQLFTVCRVRWCVVYPERGQRDAWQLCPLPLQFVAWPAVAGNRKQNKEIAEIVVCLSGCCCHCCGCCTSAHNIRQHSDSAAAVFGQSVQDVTHCVHSGRTAAVPPPPRNNNNNSNDSPSDPLLATHATKTFIGERKDSTAPFVLGGKII